MYLIDTSVWIDSLRQVDNPPARFFARLIADEVPYGITGVIYQEVLQGARRHADFEQLREYLGSLTFYAPADPVETFAEAADLYRRCREQGITIRAAADCLIARIALERGLILVHNDRDYTQIARVFPDLRVAPLPTEH
jgi:predicted nucleic acid-binding protein